MGNYPKSIAIIPDGNRRWALKNLVSLTKSYFQGSHKVWNIINWTLKYSDIETLYFYLFSKENLKRNRAQKLIVRKAIENELNTALENDFLQKKGVKAIFVGDKGSLGKTMEQKFYELEEKTRKNKRLTIVIGIGYDGRTEIVDAAKKICEKFSEKKFDLEKINEKNFNKYLYSDYPDPDLIIRTGKTHRLSGFLTYQSAYSELFFSPKSWPEFSEKDFDEAINSFDAKNRRFGK